MPEETQVEYEIEVGQEPTQARRVVVRFGTGSEVEVVHEANRPTVMLSCNGLTVRLDAAGSLCDFERAVNLLRLHLRGRD